MNKQIPKAIPEFLYPFFWDVDAKNLNPQEHDFYVINRLLDKGNLEAARWVLNSFPEEKIVETIKTKRDFSPWNAVFWTNYFQIPRNETICLQPLYLKQRKRHWPY